MARHDNCIFCKIIAGEIPSTKIFENDDIYAFADLNPQAKVHALVVPKDHFDDVSQVAHERPELLAQIVEVAKTIATEKYNGQFRLVFNTGEDAGQTVFHCHAHVLTGEKLEGE
ncbi:histidine triad nucleotide-binding protein [Alloscardovia theropitheci]|uniref:Histidine triad nucleotide-binding protein n=1 Tax=Alloscardovia theropitheci TaxID=2496842 RepID=A0A4R0QRU7_9BIFI|nr:histidine triad nucleotide-binding protein [Alloscardovia theropitheci]TCD55083.1 histidine triad nucleotide-binding protein [Alloscardovia theropitheci]